MIYSTTKSWQTLEHIKSELHWYDIFEIKTYNLPLYTVNPWCQQIIVPVSSNIKQ